MFPIKIRPQDDELLSSWLIRVALAHRTMPTTFTNLYLPETRNKLWASDLDLHADRPLLEVLSHKSALSVEELHCMTLRSYESVLFEHLYAKSGGTPFILPLQMRGRYPKSRGLRFCPYCLREGEQPYFRKKWRLSFSTACLTHECFLLDECGRCGAPVSLYKGCRQGRTSRCSRCGYDLRRCNSFKRLPDREGLEAVRWLYGIVDSGYVMLDGVPVYSFLFFRVLHHFWKVVCVWGRDIGVFGADGDPFGEGTVKYWNKAPIESQYIAYAGLVRLFREYPESFAAFCNGNDFGRTELTKDMMGVPFFYENLCHRLFVTDHPV